PKKTARLERLSSGQETWAGRPETCHHATLVLAARPIPVDSNSSANARGWRFYRNFAVMSATGLLPADVRHERLVPEPGPQLRLRERAPNGDRNPDAAY